MALKQFFIIVLLSNVFCLNVGFAQITPSSTPNVSVTPNNGPDKKVPFITVTSTETTATKTTTDSPPPPTSPNVQVTPTTTTTETVTTTNTVKATPSVPAKATTDATKKSFIDDKLIVIGTGAVTGVYYPAGGAICRLINKEKKNLGLRCAVESTAGSIYNISALQNAEIDFATIQSDWEEHAYDGTGYFAKQGKVENLRHIFSLHNEAFTVITLKKSNINKFDEIKGRIVNIGPDGSGVRATMEDIMKAKNWSRQDFKSLTSYKSNEQAKALCDGRIDVMLVASGQPSGAIQEVTSLCETKIIDVNDETIQKFVSGNPQLAITVIPGGMYAGIPNDVTTFGVKAVLVSTTDTSEDIVYNLTKVVFENLDSFKALHPVFGQLDSNKMINEGRTAPFHDGALKYYREKGLAPK